MRIKIITKNKDISVTPVKEAYVDRTNITDSRGYTISKYAGYHKLNIIVNEDSWYHVYIPDKNKAYRLLDELLKDGYADASDWVAIHKDDYRRGSAGERFVSGYTLEEFLDTQHDIVREVKSGIY